MRILSFPYFSEIARKLINIEPFSWKDVQNKYPDISYSDFMRMIFSGVIKEKTRRKLIVWEVSNEAKNHINNSKKRIRKQKPIPPEKPMQSNI